MKYCRPKKATEILKLHVEHKILRNEFKMNTKQAKKTPGFTQKRKLKNSLRKSINLGSFLLYRQCRKKNQISLKHNSTLLFSPVK